MCAIDYTTQQIETLEKGRNERVLFLKYFQRWIECRFSLARQVFE